MSDETIKHEPADLTRAYNRTIDGVRRADLAAIQPALSVAIRALDDLDRIAQIDSLTTEIKRCEGQIERNRAAIEAICEVRSDG